MKVPSTRRTVLSRANVVSPSRGSLGLSDVLISESGAIESISRHQTANRWPDASRVLDLGGSTVVPGLVDAHYHMLSTGIQLLTLDLAMAGSIGEVLELLRTAATHSLTDWVVAGHLDEDRLQDARLPTLAELDKAFPRRPVLVDHRSLHFALCNTEAIRRLRLPQLEQSGGVLRGQSLGLARGRVMEAQGEKYVEEVLRAASRAAAQRGATTVHAMEGGSLFGDLGLDVLDRIRDTLATDVVVYWCVMDVARAQEKGYAHVGGDVLVDGTLGSRTAALRNPYSDEAGSRGLLYLTEEQLGDFFFAAARSGLQPAVHVIGGRAIEVALRGIEKASQEVDGNIRWRLEHCGDVTKRQLQRVAQLRACISTQPAFTYLRGRPGGVYAQRMGPKRVRRLYPLRWMLDEGIVVSGGSDSPVTPPDSLLGLESCVNARYSMQRTTPLEALRLFTSGAAWCAGEEATKGDLAPGMQADLLVLKESPLVCKPAHIHEIEIQLAMRKGRPICGPLAEEGTAWQ